MPRHIGGSLLPSNAPHILTPRAGKHGTLQVQPLPAEDTHVLLLNERRIAEHPNGFSCSALADRILNAWAGRGPAEEVLEQFDYLLRCGGSGVPRAEIERIAGGLPQF